MKGTLRGLILIAAVLLAGTPAMARGPRYGVSVYGGYRPYYGVYRPYYPSCGPAFYPPARVYYPPPYPVYPAPVVGGFYGGPGFSFYFGR